MADYLGQLGNMIDFTESPIARIAGVGWATGEPSTLTYRDGDGELSIWYDDTDDIFRSVSDMQKIWTGSLGSGPSDFRNVPDASVADSLYGGWNGRDGQEVTTPSSITHGHNGHRWGPFWDVNGDLVAFEDRPTLGYWLKWQISPDRRWAGGVIGLNAWSHYRVHFFSPTPSANEDYSLTIGGTFTFFGAYNETYTINAEPPDVADDVAAAFVSEINTNSTIATATNVGSGAFYLESIESGRPLIPLVADSLQKLTTSNATVTSAAPDVGWAGDPLETVEL